MSTEQKPIPPLHFMDPKELKPGMKLKSTVNLMVSTHGSISVSQHHFSGHIIVATVDVEFTVPADFNVVAEAVKAIDEEVDRIMEEARTKAAPLHKQKAQLLQISYGGNDVLDAVPGDSHE